MPSSLTKSFVTAISSTGCSFRFLYFLIAIFVFGPQLAVLPCRQSSRGASVPFARIRSAPACFQAAPECFSFFLISAVLFVERGNDIGAQPLAGKALRQPVQSSRTAVSLPAAPYILEPLLLLPAVLFRLLLPGFGQFFGPAGDLGLQRGETGGLLFLLLRGFGGLLFPPLVFGLEFGEARGFFLAPFLLGALLCGDRSCAARCAASRLARASSSRSFGGLYPECPAGAGRSPPAVNPDSAR